MEPEKNGSNCANRNETAHIKAETAHIVLHENKSKEGQRNRSVVVPEVLDWLELIPSIAFLTATIVVVVVNMSVRNQLSDYELREFFRSLQDLLALSLDANLSFDSAEFLSDVSMVSREL